jgi:hypothetical protein
VHAQRAQSQPPVELDMISVESVPGSDPVVPMPAHNSESAELTEARLLLGQAIEALASMRRVMDEMERRINSLESRAPTQPVTPAPEPFDPAWAGGPLFRLVSGVARWLGRLVRGGAPDTRRIGAARVERADP